jgi:hypothetical protein
MGDFLRETHASSPRGTSAIVAIMAGLRLEEGEAHRREHRHHGR